MDSSSSKQGESGESGTIGNDEKTAILLESGKGKTPELGPLSEAQRKADKEKDDLVRYMSNGNKTKLMTSGLLNTAALSTNASLLALILKLEKMNATASISVCLIIVSVTLQLMMAIFTLLEYRATLIVDRDPEKLLRKRTLKKRPGYGRNGINNGRPNKTEKTSSYTFCKPMELQFSVAICTVILTVVNTFIIALTSNIREDLESPASMTAGTVNYQSNV